MHKEMLVLCVLIAWFIKYCRYIFAISSLLLACYFHSFCNSFFFLFVGVFLNCNPDLSLIIIIIMDCFNSVYWTFGAFQNVTLKSGFCSSKRLYFSLEQIRALVMLIRNPAGVFQHVMHCILDFDPINFQVRAQKLFEEIRRWDKTLKPEFPRIYHIKIKINFLPKFHMTCSSFSVSSCWMFFTGLQMQNGLSLFAFWEFPIQKLCSERKK